MRTATGTLTTAITTKERAPVHVVLSDPLRNGSWAMDPGIARDIAADTLESLGEMGILTTYVESVEIDEALATDLPAGARSFPGGYASAQATIVLAGSVGSMRLAEAFSGFDNPLSTLAPRIGLPITADLGMIGTAGPETVRPFVGKVRSCSVDPDAGTVTLVALDNREKFRTPVVLPVVFGDNHGSIRPGLNAQFLIDWIARRQGFYVTPPARANCFLLATLHGSAWPEIGTIPVQARTLPTLGPVRFGPFDSDGLLGLYEYDTAAVPTIDYAVAPGLGTDTGDNLFIQAYRMSPDATAGTIATVRNAASTWLAKVQVTTGHFYIDVTRNGVAATQLDIPAAALTTPGEHYLAVHLAFTATGADVHARVDATTYTGTVVVANPTGSPDLDTVRVAGPGLALTLADVQVTNEAFSAGMWDNAFVPTAILDSSLNELTSTPIVDTSDPWLLVQAIADAEQGFANFNGDTFIFRNRDHLTGGAAVATITTDGSISFANLKQSASSDEAIDTVLNYVSGTATPYVLDPASTLVWSLSEVMSVPSGGSITIPVDFPGPLHTLTSRTYRASQTADGTGGDITNLTLSSVAVTASSYLTTVYNPNAFAAYLVGNLAGGTPGEPNLTVVGRCTRPAENGYLSVATDAPSVALYGTQPLDLPETPWRQAAVPLAALTAALLANLKDPHAEIADLAIVGDPRLQLGDRVRVADPDGLVLDAEFWLTALKTSYDTSGGLAQSVTLRLA